MNIIKWFKDKAGKISMSAAQLAGVSAVGAAAVVGGVYFLQTPSEGNNMFIPPMDTEQEVVYVSGASSGATYGKNGEIKTSFNAAPSRAMEIIARNEERAAQLNPQSNDSGYYEVGGFQDPAQHFGSAGGFDLTGKDNKGTDTGAVGPMGGMQEMMANLQNTMGQMADGAAGGPGGKGGKGGKGGQGKGDKDGSGAEGAGGLAAASAAMDGFGKVLQSVTPNYGGVGGGAGGSNGGGNEFVVMDSGKNSDTPPDGNVVLGPDGQPLNPDDEDDPALKLNGKFSRFASDRDGNAKGARYTGRNDLENMRKKSTAIAKNRNRSANEPGSIFLAGAILAGGIRLLAGGPNTGGGTSSPTFEDPYSGVNHKDLGDGIKNIDTQGKLEYEEFQNKIKLRNTWFWVALAFNLLAMAVIPWIIDKWPVGTIIAICMGVTSGILTGISIYQAHDAWEKWKDYSEYQKGSELWSYIVGGIGQVGVIASFIWPSAFQTAEKAIWNFLKTLGKNSLQMLGWKF